MLKAGIHHLLLFAFISLTVKLSYAQNPQEKIKLTQLGINEGLSHTDVTSIVQDKSGYIWFGTNNGLNRYDGNKIKIFKSSLADSNSLPESRINKLHVDNKGVLWIGMRSEGLCIYNQKLEKFQKISLSGSSRPNTVKFVSVLTEDDNGVIWASIRDIGLFLLKNEKGKIQIIRKIHNSDISSISSIIFLPSREALIAAQNNLYTYNPVSNLLKKVNFKGRTQPVQTLYKDRNGLIWAGGKNGLIQLTDYHGGTIINNYKRVRPDIIPANVKNIFQDKHGTLWVSVQGSGAYRLSLHEKDQSVLNVDYITNKNLKNDYLGGIERINCFLEDKYGLLWIGASGSGAGYININKKNIHFIGNQHNYKLLPDDYITAVYAADETVWIGTRKGLCIYKKGIAISKFFKDIYITSIYQDSKGIYWIGTRNNGLKRMSALNGKYSEIKAGSALSFPNATITSITEDQAGRFWIAINTAGITILTSKLEPYMFLQKEAVNQLSSNNINYLYKDPAYPCIWVSTKDAGVDKIHITTDGKVKTKNYQYRADGSSISANYAWPIIRSSDSVLWIGTLGGGLNKIEQQAGGKEKITFYTIENGLFDNDIEAIQMDEAGNLWLAGYGLTRFNPETGATAFFDHHDGMQSSAFKVGASFKDNKGRLYFGGLNGLNYFYPKDILSTTAPDLVLTGLRIFNNPIQVNTPFNGRTLLKQALNWEKSISLTASDDDFTIEFAGLQHAQTSKLKYYYKLEGYNKGWVESEVPSASFANLGSGTYEFKVFAAFNGINSDIRSLAIHISPPWWFTWWAFICYGLIIITILAVYRHIITKENMLKSELLIAEKQKKLDQAKFDFFTNISHELRTPLSLIYGPVTELLEAPASNREKNRLWLIYNSTKRLMSLTNQLLDFRKLESGELKLNAAEGDIIRFIREVWYVFKHHAETKSISYHISTEQEKAIAFFDRRQMELVLTNLLSNAFKYTADKGMIHLNIIIKGDKDADAVYEYQNNKKTLITNYLEIVVEDSGKGIPANEIEKIFNSYYQAANSTSLKSIGTGLGLSIAKGIIELHQGFIRAESRLGQGSKFIIGLPFGSAHLSKGMIQDHNTPGLLEPYQNNGSQTADTPADPVLTETDNTEYKPAKAIIPQNGTEDKPERLLLIVEDNADILNYLKETFSSSFKVAAAKNGREGYEKVKALFPDLVISDVMMPEMNGIEMCRKIKTDPEVNFIPIILLTARTASVYEIEGIETGADDYITKPFNIRLLKAKVSSCLQSRSLVREYYKKLMAADDSIPEINAADESFIKKIVEVVEANISNSGFGVAALSEELAMSKSALFKRVKDITDSSPMDFIRNMRIRKAAHLLLNSGLKINEIALEVGISDIKYFREQFKKYYSVTPSQYVKNAKAEMLRSECAQR